MVAVLAAALIGLVDEHDVTAGKEVVGTVLWARWGVSCVTWLYEGGIVLIMWFVVVVVLCAIVLFEWSFTW